MQKKYKLLPDVVNVVALRRVVALVDIPEAGVRAGVLGSGPRDTWDAVWAEIHRTDLHRTLTKHLTEVPIGDLRIRGGVWEAHTDAGWVSVRHLLSRRYFISHKQEALYQPIVAVCTIRSGKRGNPR